MVKSKINAKAREQLKESSKEKKTEKKMEKMLNDAVKAINGINSGENELAKREITFSASKPISQIKKGDKIKIDDETLEVDAHYILIDHGGTKEMVIEIFNPETDKDMQLRYFDDQVESTLDLYELQDIMYFKKAFKKIEW